MHTPDKLRKDTKGSEELALALSSSCRSSRKGFHKRPKNSLVSNLKKAYGGS
jgi:hypothetical protein